RRIAVAGKVDEVSMSAITKSKYWVALALGSVLVFSDAQFDLTRLVVAKFDAFTPAEAVVGRPLTPMSYAGVARRTSRRTVRRSTYGAYGAPYGAYGVTALPAGCVYGPYYGSYAYNCNGTYYQQQNNTYVQIVPGN